MEDPFLSTESLISGKTVAISKKSIGVLTYLRNSSVALRTESRLLKSIFKNIASFPVSFLRTAMAASALSFDRLAM